MFATIKSRIASTRPSILCRLASPVVRLLAALTFCILVSGTLTPPSATAASQITAQVASRTWVAYNANHVPDPNGALTDMTGLTYDQDGHTWDLYGNQLVLNYDGSISDVNNIVVGYVISDGPVNTIP